jgi:hypothetical protein
MYLEKKDASPNPINQSIVIKNMNHTATTSEISEPPDMPLTMFSLFSSVDP